MFFHVGEKQVINYPESFLLLSFFCPCYCIPHGASSSLSEREEEDGLRRFITTDLSTAQFGEDWLHCFTSCQIQFCQCNGEIEILAEF